MAVDSTGNKAIPDQHAMTIIYPWQLDKMDPPVPLDDASYKYKLLAEGDSWFATGAIPSSNLLYEMLFPGVTTILSLARSGDTIVHMGQLAANPVLTTMLAKKGFNYKFDAMLLSGGGNDLIDSARAIIRDKPGQASKASAPESYVEEKILADTLTGVRESYARIVQVRDAPDSQSKGVPVIVHTYDYATPRNAPANFVLAPILGPWLYKALSQFDTGLQQAISDYLFDRLAETLLGLSTGKDALPNVHVVDTRNTLVRAKVEGGNSNDWLNEIHPNGGGYRKIAAKLSAVLAGLLP